MPTQERINAWFDNFIEQVYQPPYRVNMDLPVDVGRIYVTLDQPKENGMMMDNPFTNGKTLYEQRNELYRLASEGKLYVFPLAKDEELAQIRVEPDSKLLYDLKSEVVNQPAPTRPVEQKLGLLKRILNTLFGAFEAERLQLKEQYASALHAYNCHTKGVLMQNSGINSLGGSRLTKMGAGQEMARVTLPSAINALNAKLQSNDLLPWQRECNEAKLKLYTAMDNAEPLPRDLYSDIIAKNMVSRMGEYADKELYKFSQATEMQRFLHENPDKAPEYVDMIRQNTYIRQIVDQDNLLVVFSACSSNQVIDGLIDRWLRDLGGNENTKAFAAEVRQMMNTQVDTIESLERDINTENRFKTYVVESQANRAKLELLTAKRDGRRLSVEQCQDILARIIVGRLGKAASDAESSQPNELRDLLRENASVVNQMTEAIKNTNVVKNMARSADIDEIINNTRTLKSLDQVVKAALDETNAVTNQKYVGKGTVKEQVINAGQPQNQAKGLIG